MQTLIVHDDAYMKAYYYSDSEGTLAPHDVLHHT